MKMRQIKKFFSHVSGWIFLIVWAFILGMLFHRDISNKPRDIHLLFELFKLIFISALIGIAVSFMVSVTIHHFKRKIEKSSKK
ncbi:MAG: hypothetical protein ACP5OG_02235 [Candidatus Nanoarchaeia archaeon]